ncbi:hypothetical protein QBC46DRAFT_382790 [Diplogelasinospora grovesii]|uniref:Uncharacterized protein n=1 Tax=Diplogelasinospora grovesii TaxID=303347 RepID=A0AAN6S661_9PEZI|nr:hypothetical protein QBC46DRAFT_382790 [Diplogelasinospora grovesii]
MKTQHDVCKGIQGQLLCFHILLYLYSSSFPFAFLLQKVLLESALEHREAGQSSSCMLPFHMYRTSAYQVWSYLIAVMAHGPYSLWVIYKAGR